MLHDVNRFLVKFMLGGLETFKPLYMFMDAFVKPLSANLVCLRRGESFKN